MAHRRELTRFILFLAAVVVLEGLLSLVPGAEPGLPWLPSEPLPLVRLLPARVKPPVTARPVIQVARLRRPTVPPPLAAGSCRAAVPAPVRAADLEPRPPAQATALEIPDHALDSFFMSLLASRQAGRQRLTRVLHWGDSTIAGDGITGTVRHRLRQRFGSGGPGFLAAYTDPVWSLLPGIERSAEGPWQSLTIISEGPDERRCGLAGTAATAEEAASLVLAGYRHGSSRQLLQMVDLFYQAQAGGGTLSVLLDGTEVRRLVTAAEQQEDRFMLLDLRGQERRRLRLAALGDGPVTVYGAALETRGPGITWETFGIAGTSVWNLLRQEEQHFAGQIARRHPDLLVLQTGGNELHHPGLAVEQGRRYERAMRLLLQRMLDAAPQASCLVIAPLDQATRERGKVVSDPLLERVISIQRHVAGELGCAFWDARHVMGDDGGFARWLERRPAYAWTDLKHLTNRGLELVGSCLADALLAAYDAWRAVNQDVFLPPPVPTPTVTPMASPPVPSPTVSPCEPSPVPAPWTTLHELLPIPPPPPTPVRTPPSENNAAPG